MGVFVLSKTAAFESKKLEKLRSNYDTVLQIANMKKIFRGNKPKSLWKKIRNVQRLHKQQP